MGWLWPRSLPIPRNAGRWHLAAIVAVMAYLAALCGVEVIALNDARAGWNRTLDGTLTLQLPPDTSPARLEVVMALLRQTPGVTAAQPLQPAETARLLEPWLGKSVPVDIMPLPRLVDVRINPGAAPDLAGLQQRLHEVAPEAQLQDHRNWLTRLLGLTSRLRIVAVGIVVATIIVAAMTAAAAAAGGFARDADRIMLLHALGAEELDIGRALVIPAAGLGLLGGAIGAVAAAVTVRALARSMQSLGVSSVAPALGDYRILALLALVVLAGCIVVAAAAATVTWRHLLRLP